MKTSKSCGASLIEEFKKLIGISKSKTCKNCGAQLADNAAFCGECGEKNPIDSAEVNSDTQNTQKKHGHFWNILHYNELKNTIKKKPIIAIVTLCAAVILISILVFAVNNFISPDLSDSAKDIAVYQIQKQTISKDEPTVYDIKIVDKDGNGRFIITATTKHVFETWWVVLVEISSDGEYYRAYANYHGNGGSANDWIKKYKTESKYSWGQPALKD